MLPHQRIGDVPILVGGIGPDRKSYTGEHGDTRKQLYSVAAFCR